MKVTQYFMFVINIALANSAPQISDTRYIESNDALRNSDRIVIGDDVLKLNSGKPAAKKNCCPYNFDGKNCQIVNDRKLCGYDKNSGGNPAESWTRIDNRCWFRRGRVECGYVDGPYDGIRRPPVYDVSYRTQSTITESNIEYESIERLVNKITPRIKPEPISRVSEYMPKTKKGKSTTTVPKCVEIRKTIVCGILDN